jgi:undecaprenyl-diphosphatase
MPLLHVILLGIIQGLTEFLPISSSAHLALIPQLLGWQDQGLAFDIALHAGTLLAILVYFFADWVQIIGQAFGLNVTGDPNLKRNRGLFWLLVIATIPVGVAGLVFQKRAETLWRNDFTMIGGMLIAVGLLMWLAEYAGRRQKDLGHISLLDAIAVGLAQAVAIIPGTSRSGITIAAGLFRNFDRATAARFSFLLSTPAIAAAAAKDAWDLFKHEGGFPPGMRTPFLVGILVSTLAGALTIKLLLAYLRRRSLGVFVVYRIVFGIMVIALAKFFR